MNSALFLFGWFFVEKSIYFLFSNESQLLPKDECLPLNNTSTVSGYGLLRVGDLKQGRCLRRKELRLCCWQKVWRLNGGCRGQSTFCASRSLLQPSTLSCNSRQSKNAWILPLMRCLVNKGNFRIRQCFETVSGSFKWTENVGCVLHKCRWLMWKTQVIPIIILSNINSINS